jgi:hypothetical protein
MLISVCATSKRRRVFAIHVLFLFFVIAFVAPQVRPEAVDVSGTWDLVVTSQEGTAHPWITLKQDGEKITGTYNGKMGTIAFEGTIKGNDIHFLVSLKFQDVPITVAYSGTVNNDTMQGTARFGSTGTGNWSGKRRKNQH